MNLFSHLGCHSLRGKVCSSVDVEATGRVPWPDVGCGGRGFPAWLAAVGARGIGVLLALKELSRQGAHLLGPVLPKSDQDLQTQLRRCTTALRAVCLEERPTLPQRIWLMAPL